MASEQRLPDAGLGHALAARVTPRQRSGRRSVLGRTPGTLATRAIRFGSLVGLSTLNRQTVVEVGTTAMTVRPPIDYWPWDDSTATGRAERSAAAPPEFLPTGDARLDAIRKARLAKEAAAGKPPTAVARRTASPARPVRRGLPRTTSRQGRTAAGIGTAPGAIAHRIQPESAAGRPQPAGPFATPSSAPTPLAPVATTGGRSALLASAPAAAPGSITPGSVATTRQWPGDRPGALTPPAAARTAAPAVQRTPAAARPAAPATPSRPKRAAEATNVAEFLDANPAGDGWDKVRAVRRLIEARKQQEQATMWPGDQPGTAAAPPTPSPSPFSSPAPSPRRPAGSPPPGDAGVPRAAAAAPDVVQRRLAAEQPPARTQPSPGPAPQSALRPDPTPNRPTAGLGTALAERPTSLETIPTDRSERHPAPAEPMPMSTPLPATVAPPVGVPTVQRTTAERATPSEPAIGLERTPATARPTGFERPTVARSMPVAPLPAATRALSSTVARPSVITALGASPATVVQRSPAPTTAIPLPAAAIAASTEPEATVAPAERAPIRRGVVAPSPLPLAAAQRTPMPSAAMVALLSAADGTLPGPAERYGAGVLQRRAVGGGIVWQQTAAPVRRSTAPAATPTPAAARAEVASSTAPSIVARRAATTTTTGTTTGTTTSPAATAPVSPVTPATRPVLQGPDRLPTVLGAPTPAPVSSTPPVPNPTGWAPPANAPQAAPVSSVSRADVIRRALADARDQRDVPAAAEVARPPERLAMQWVPDGSTPAPVAPTPVPTTPAPPPMPFIATFPTASAPAPLPAALVAAQQAATAPTPTIARTPAAPPITAPAVRITSVPGPRHLVRPATPGSLFRTPVVAAGPGRAPASTAGLRASSTPIAGTGAIGRSTPGLVQRSTTDEPAAWRPAPAALAPLGPAIATDWAVAPAAVRVETVTPPVPSSLATITPAPTAAPPPRTRKRSAATPAATAAAATTSSSATATTVGRAPGTTAAPVSSRITADLLGGARRSLVAPGPGTLRRALAAAEATAPASPELLGHDRLGFRDGGDAERSVAQRGPVAGVPFLSRAIDDPRPAAPPRPADLGETFLAELSRHRQERPRPLPVQFRPIAEIVAPNVTARISTSKASQEALRAVGKVAATTGDVIHLARTPLAATGRGAEVLAHELTHVAHASPAPRFFDDHRPSKEEQTAEAVGRVMRRAPILPRASAASAATPLVDRASMAPPPVQGPAPTAGSGGAVLRRTPAGRAAKSAPPRAPKVPATTPGFTSAAALAAHYMGEAPPPSSPSRSSASTVIRRSPTSAPIRRALEVEAPAPRSNRPGTGEIEQFEDPTRFPASSSTHLIDQFEHLLELLEERVITEIERRGRRYRGGF